MAKAKKSKKSVKRAATKRPTKAPSKRARAAASEAVALDPIAAALQRRRMAMLSR